MYENWVVNIWDGLTSGSLQCDLLQVYFSAYSPFNAHLFTICFFFHELKPLLRQGLI